MTPNCPTTKPHTYAIKDRLISLRLPYRKPTACKRRQKIKNYVSIRFFNQYIPKLTPLCE